MSTGGEGAHRSRKLAYTTNCSLLAGATTAIFQTQYYTVLQRNCANFVLLQLWQTPIDFDKFLAQNMSRLCSIWGGRTCNVILSKLIFFSHAVLFLMPRQQWQKQSVILYRYRAELVSWSLTSIFSTNMAISETIRYRALEVAIRQATYKHTFPFFCRAIMTGRKQILQDIHSTLNPQQVVTPLKSVSLPTSSSVNVMQGHGTMHW